MTNIFVAGHNGMVGGSIHRLLSTRPDINLITAEKDPQVIPACPSDRYLRKHHWSYRAAGVYGKAFMELVGYWDSGESTQSRESSYFPKIDI